MRRLNLFDTNSYVNLEVVYNITSLLDLESTSTFISSSTEISLFSFLELLSEHEIKNSTCRNGHNRYGVVLTFLLDKAYSEEILSLYASKIADNVGNLPFYAFYKKCGEGNYLIMYICERYFYPEGKDIVVLAKSDRYINAKSHKICKKTDENAVLMHKKGDIIKTYTSLFSLKVEIFKYATEDQFLYKMAKFKELIMDLMEEIGKTIIEKGTSIKKMVIRKLPNGQKGKAKIWNSKIRYIENRLNGATEALINTECYDEAAKTELMNLKERFVGYLEEGETTYHSRFYITTNLGFHNDYSKVKGMAELFTRKFDEALAKLMKRLIPCF